MKTNKKKIKEELEKKIKSLEEQLIKKMKNY